MLEFIAYSTAILDHFLKTRSSGKLELVLSKEVIIADYQCMTFWYKSRYTTGMTFKTMQLYDWNMIELSHSLRTANEQWVFGEMPLKRDVMKSKVLNWNIESFYDW